MDARGALVVAALLLLTGCSSALPQPTPTPAPTEASPSPSPSPAPLDAASLGAYEPAAPSSSLPCLDERFEHLAVATEPRATALVTGDGAVGVVLGHQSNAYLCQWAPEAERLAGLGYRVIIPNLQLTDPLGAMLAAEQRLRAEGVDEVVLAGASMGGLLAIAAAAVVDEAPAAVIALAPPLAYRGTDARDFAPHVEAALLIEVGSGDGSLPEQAIDIAALLPSPPQLVEIDAIDHGVPLLEHAAARDAFDAFLAEQAPPD